MDEIALWRFRLFEFQHKTGEAGNEKRRDKITTLECETYFLQQSFGWVWAVQWKQGEKGKRKQKWEIKEKKVQVQEQGNHNRMNIDNR